MIPLGVVYICEYVINSGLVSVTVIIVYYFTVYVLNIRYEYLPKIIMDLFPALPAMPIWL